MEKLKVGQSFEVVKVINNQFSDKTLFKIGGFTTGVKGSKGLIKCMGNGSMIRDSFLSKLFMSTHYLNMRIGRDVKSIGRLTITSIKKGGSNE